MRFWLGFVFFLAAVERVSAQQSDARQDRPEPPPLTAVRAGEDYSYLRDPAKRRGGNWERIKFIPLNERGDIYLTLGDEVRLRFEGLDDNPIASPDEPSDAYLRFRAFPYADLHLGSHFRVFGQLIAAWSTRSDELKTTAADETSVDLVQGFLDWRLPLNEGAVTLRGGRQVLSYGSQRLLSVGPNIRTSFDGGLLRWEKNHWQADAIYARPVLPDFDWFDNEEDELRRIRALYAIRSLPQWGDDGALDLFYLLYENDEGTFHAGTARERRHTFGARYAGSRNTLRWDIEGKYQFGDFGNVDIRAGSINLIGRHTLLSRNAQPFLEIQSNLTSGDEEPDDGRLGTYNAMFPIAEFFGDIGLFGPGNILNVRPIVGFKPKDNLTLSSAASFNWRHRRNDGIYGPVLQLRQGPETSDERYIGVIAEFMADWQFNRHLSFRFNYSFFEPGDFVEDAGISHTIHHLMIHGELRY